MQGAKVISSKKTLRICTKEKDLEIKADETKE